MNMSYKIRPFPKEHPILKSFIKFFIKPLKNYAGILCLLLLIKSFGSPTGYRTCLEN